MLFMNKNFRFMLPTIAIIFLFSSLSTGVSAQTGVLREILKRMDTNNKALVSLKSNIKMSKVNPQIGTEDLTQGSLSYLPGKTEKQIYLRIDWTKPLEESLAIANGKYVIYRPNTKQAIVGSVDSAKGSS